MNAFSFAVEFVNFVEGVKCGTDVEFFLREIEMVPVAFVPVYGVRFLVFRWRVRVVGVVSDTIVTELQGDPIDVGVSGNPIPLQSRDKRVVVRRGGGRRAVLEVQSNVTVTRSH